MPQLTDLKETALYVDNVARARKFYQDILGLAVLYEDERFCALDVVGKHILLLFRHGTSLTPTELPGGTIPTHDGSGQIHAAFSIDKQALTEWEDHLKAHGVEILSGVTWPRGGRSIYFRDPDGHLLELLTPGVWATY